MAALAGRSLNHVIFEANGKVKCTDISIPSTDFKIGKMKVLRLGNTNSFSISIQQTAGQRSFASKKTIPVSQRLDLLLENNNLQRYLFIILSIKSISLKLTSFESFHAVDIEKCCFTNV